jgi:glycosyltransferase involved in cell wall biosynthesis
MKICFFGLDMSYKRGVNKLSVNLINSISKLKTIDEILVICDIIDKDVYQLVNNDKITFHLLGNVKKSDFVRIFIRNMKYNRFYKEINQYDVVHVLDDRALPMAFLNIKPLVVTIHNVMMNEFKLIIQKPEVTGVSGLPNAVDLHLPQFFLEFISASKARKLIVNSPLITYQLKKLYGNVIENKIKVISPGFDENIFSPFITSKIQAKKYFNIDASSMLLLHIGGSLERKGMSYLLYALDYLYKTGQLVKYDIHLMVLGKIASKWDKFISKFKDRIIELPYMSENFMPYVYKAADLLIMPSISEGWGIALIEALACGTPVIVSPYVPSAHALNYLDVVMIEDSINNSIKFGQNIIGMLNGSQKKSIYWERIYDDLVLNYSWNKYARNHFQVYKNII